ncbi:MAG: CDP-diacylglycerol--glycerol-3-phosphate 3-phosphatidyltransferase [Deltaproteobacteria bacterium]|nr:CDP-diacylglycerol--glycerol-3-phosphate 3-phosphatidyltransferase [Deltaproteobacteria bacterium]
MERSSFKRVLLNPNNLTLYRMYAVPAVVLLLIWPNRVFLWIAAALFALAAITDGLDGYYARRWGLVSNLGKFLDPLADKLMVASALIMLTANGWVPGWVTTLIVGREIAVTGLRGIGAEKGVVIAAEKLGKWKMGFQIAALIPLLIHYPYFGVDFHAVGMALLLIALVLTLWSGVAYFKNFFALIK